MKSKKLKIIGIAVMTVVIVCLIAGFIYFDTHYAIINKKVYRNDIKTIVGTNLTKKEDTDYHISLEINSVREVNKCIELEEMRLSSVPENSFSEFINFPNLKKLMILSSDISSADCEKISQFDKLEELIFYETTVDFTGFKSDTVSSIGFVSGTFKNFEVLAECKSLKIMKIGPYHTNIMEDISVFADFDYIEELWLSADTIEDISSFLEMDSLKTLYIDKGAISEADVKLLEDKGVTVTYYN
ncbi:MAG: hypothetical protein K2G36_05100 [Ruminococcus sp.]|nr:hypothetical protein [Ruminococcus sp.]